MSADAYLRIYAVIRGIPRGRVTTYGAVARLAGLPGRARQVGYALHALPPEVQDVPWQRVVNAQGRISLGEQDGASALQRSILEQEGVIFGHAGLIDLDRYGWRPDDD